MLPSVQKRLERLELDYQHLLTRHTNGVPGRGKTVSNPMAFRLARTAASVALLVCLTAFALHQPLSGESPPRIVAIGDINGAREEFAGILQHLRLIDDQHRWWGVGPAHDPGGAG